MKIDPLTKLAMDSFSSGRDGAVSVKTVSDSHWESSGRIASCAALLNMMIFNMRQFDENPTIDDLESLFDILIGKSDGY